MSTWICYTPFTFEHKSNGKPKDIAIIISSNVCFIIVLYRQIREKNSSTVLQVYICLVNFGVK